MKAPDDGINKTLYSRTRARPRSLSNGGSRKFGDTEKGPIMGPFFFMA